VKLLLSSLGASPAVTHPGRPGLRRKGGYTPYSDAEEAVMTHPEPVRPAPEPPARDQAPSPASRRTFLAGASAATVAGAAVVAGVGVATAGTAAAAAATTSRGPSGRQGQAVVAYVRDVAGGEVRLMSGEREVVVHDRALARTLSSHFDQQEG